ncbi:unnamed protein product [Natator depressus]
MLWGCPNIRGVVLYKATILPSLGKKSVPIFSPLFSGHPSLGRDRKRAGIQTFLRLGEADLGSGAGRRGPQEAAAPGSLVSLCSALGQETQPRSVGLWEGIQGTAGAERASHHIDILALFWKPKRGRKPAVKERRRGDGAGFHSVTIS